MNPFEMVVLIVAIVTLGGVIRSKNGTRRGKGAARPVEDQMENQLLRSEIKELKEVVVGQNFFSRKQMLKLFREQFLGINVAGKNCIIENEEEIYFDYDI